MDAVATAFLVVGGIGVALLVLSLVAGEIAHLGAADADGPVSLEVVAALLGGVGFGGAAAVALLPEDLSTAPTVALALLVGAVAALPLAWGAYRLSRALRDMPTTETLTRDHLAGAQGVVVSAVPAGGYGEVRLQLAGQGLKYTARSDVPLPAGTPVYVVEALSETAVHVVSTAPDPLPDLGGPA
ncbi:NfeD family protein [Geodermatophilus sp. FMUSA9-8]|uniref:NfeD family protein n=1 Tax=Geodermatophilus sp. FMUSA9-8 TaxID=3120155 RepID=UPI00300A6275